MSSDVPVARHEYLPGQLTAVLDFLKRMRYELRTLRRVRVWRNRVQVFDVNGDHFEVAGLGYPDADVVAVLDALNTAYRPEAIHEPIEAEFKEFKTGRRYPWAADRVM